MGDEPALDLASEAGRQAYRRHLRQYLRGWRWLGLALVIIALGMIAWPRLTGDWVMLGAWPLQHVGWVVMGIGWMILAGIIVRRTRYHKANMARWNKPG